MPERHRSPAESLVGRRVSGRWTIVAPFGGADGTGSTFSTGYIAEGDDGDDQVFVKALDLSAALGADDFTVALQRLMEAYNFERDLLRKCGERRLYRIVRVLDDGKLEDPNWPFPVPYLVFEHADRGDVRDVLASLERLDLAFAFRALHHISVGLQQLHSIGVAHQDVKPSNVVVFDKDGSKLVDLGRSSTKDRQAQWDNYLPAGDPNYCPPEQMYGYGSLSWDRRRESTDLYHLGSMLLFFFADMSATEALLSKLPREHHPFVWRGDHDGIVPYLAAAFDAVLSDLRSQVPAPVADDVCDLFRWLSHPDLEARGHPDDRAGRGSNFGLQRFISAFNRLARDAENGLIPSLV